MKISSVEFIKSVGHIRQLPQGDLLEVAFAGRSNVGKSSLINCLLNRKKMAKTSSTPGKTRQLNYFLINNRFYFVDLPGYGFARVSRTERKHWQELIECFLSDNNNLRGVITIIDSRIGATDLDLQLLEWLVERNLNVILVATKSDKLSRSALLSQMKRLSGELASYARSQIIPFSSVKGFGKKQVWQEITNLVG